MLRLLLDEAHGYAVLLEIAKATGTEGLSETARVSRPPIAQVVERRRAGEPRVRPITCLIDRANVPVGWVGVGDEELHLGVSP